RGKLALAARNLVHTGDVQRQIQDVPVRSEGYFRDLPAGESHSDLSRSRVDHGCVGDHCNCFADTRDLEFNVELGGLIQPQNYRSAQVLGEATLGYGEFVGPRW